MPHPSKAKGDRAEREAAALLADELGLPVRRKLGAGRHDDHGDLEGLPNLTLEVKNQRDIAGAVRDGLNDSQREQRNAGTDFGAAMIRRPGGRWFIAMTPEQFATLYRESL